MAPCPLAVVAVRAAPAAAVAFSQQTLAFTALNTPVGVAAEADGKVFDAGYGTNSVDGLAAGGTEQILPFPVIDCHERFTRGADAAGPP